MWIFIYSRKILVVGFPVSVSSQVFLSVTAMLLARSLVLAQPIHLHRANILSKSVCWKLGSESNMEPVLKERCSDLLQVDVGRNQFCKSVVLGGGVFFPRWLGSNLGPYECLAGVLPVNTDNVILLS